MAEGSPSLSRLEEGDQVAVGILDGEISISPWLVGQGSASMDDPEPEDRIVEFLYVIHTDSAAGRSGNEGLSPRDDRLIIVASAPGLVIREPKMDLDGVPTEDREASLLMPGREADLVPEELHAAGDVQYRQIWVGLKHPHLGIPDLGIATVLAA